MRVVTWNCNGAFRKKYQCLSALDADILVIQECEDPAQSNDIQYKEFAANHLWQGTSKSKGLGVFAKQTVHLKRIELPLHPLELFLPCMIDRDTPLLATWTKQANSPNFAYIGQLWKFLQHHREFLRTPSAMLVGDLNSNKQWDEWDRWWNHTDVVRELAELGLESAYHLHFAEAQGAESRPTLYLQRNQAKPYHIDYGFFGNNWKIISVQVGMADEWLTHSDHMPVIFDISTHTP